MTTQRLSCRCRELTWMTQAIRILLALAAASLAREWFKAPSVRSPTDEDRECSRESCIRLCERQCRGSCSPRCQKRGLLQAPEPELYQDVCAPVIRSRFRPDPIHRDSPSYLPSCHR